MGRLLALAGALLGGWLGWAAAERLGGVAAFLVSLVGTGLGVYAANRITRYFRS